MTTEMQLRAETVESDLRKSSQIRNQEMTKRLSALEIELAEEKNVRKINEYEGKQTLSELSIEFEVQRSELTRIVREKDVLHERLRDVEGKYEVDKKQFIQYRKDTAASILAMDKTIKEYKINVAELEGRILKAKSIELDNQYKSQIMLSNMDALKSEQSALIDAIKKESQIRATDMEKLYVEKLEKIKENTREALDKVCINERENENSCIFFIEEHAHTDIFFTHSRCRSESLILYV